MTTPEQRMAARYEMVVDRANTYRDCLDGIYRQARGLDPFISEMLRCVLYEPDKYTRSADWDAARGKHADYKYRKATP